MSVRLLFLLSLFAFCQVKAQESVAVIEEAVTFSGSEAVYSGTLSRPAGKGPFPLVILVSGMGLQDRDWTFIKGKYQLAKMLSDSLNRQGIAVLRYDDRGHKQSTGSPETLTSFEDLAADVYAAVSAMKKRKDVSRVGLLGHSLGGILSILAASAHSDIDFVITLAGSYQNGNDIMMEQAQTLKRWRTNGNMSEAEVVSNGQAFVRNWTAYANGGKEGLDTVRKILKELITYQVRTMSEADMSKNLKIYKDSTEMMAKIYAEALEYYTSPHQLSFARYDPLSDFSKLACPVLVLFGERDQHVTVASNLPRVANKMASGALRDITVHIVPEADHAFSTRERMQQGYIVPGLGRFIGGWINWKK